MGWTGEVAKKDTFPNLYKYFLQNQPRIVYVIVHVDLVSEEEYSLRFIHMGDICQDW